MDLEARDKARIALAEKIAKAIFRLGSEPESPCTRIQFLGEKWPDSEIRQGWMNEGSLARSIADTLEADQAEATGSAKK